jgi:hypothetical protein
VLLLSLEQRQRQQMLAAMSDSERAGLVVLLDESTRLQVLCCWRQGLKTKAKDELAGGDHCASLLLRALF